MNDPVLEEELRAALSDSPWDSQPIDPDIAGAVREGRATRRRHRQRAVAVGGAVALTASVVIGASWVGVGRSIEGVATSGMSSTGQRASSGPEIEMDLGSFGLSLAPPAVGDTPQISTAQAAAAVAATGMTGPIQPSYKLAALTGKTETGESVKGLLVWQVIFRHTPAIVYGPADLPAAVRSEYQKQDCQSQVIVDANTGEVVSGMMQQCGGR